MSNMERKLMSLEMFNCFSESELKTWSPHFEIIHLKHRAVLFTEDEPINIIYVVFYGSFKIQRMINESGPVIFNFLGPGQFLGVAIAEVSKPTYPATAIANEDSAVLACSLEFYRDVLSRKSAIREYANTQIRERFLEFQNDRCMENVLASQRIADLFLRLWERQKKEMGPQILIPITRKDIAQRLGIQPETVIRILSQWTKKNWIMTSNKRIVISNYIKLKELRDERSHRKTERPTPADSENVG